MRTKSGLEILNFGYRKVSLGRRVNLTITKTTTGPVLQDPQLAKKQHIIEFGQGFLLDGCFFCLAFFVTYGYAFPSYLDDGSKFSPRIL